MANQANPKKRWNKIGTQVDGFPSKIPTNVRPKPQGPAVTRKYCAKCGHMNRNTLECRVGTNRCFCCMI